MLGVIRENFAGLFVVVKETPLLQVMTASFVAAMIVGLFNKGAMTLVLVLLTLPSGGFEALKALMASVSRLGEPKP